MDLSDPHCLELFLEVYGTLPRAGPGAKEHTRRALRMVPGHLPRTVLDLGCGPGAQTLDLATALPEARLLALDILPAMVEEARRRIGEAGLGDRVSVQVGDMSSPPVAANSQQLIWCEGAIYFLGVENALRGWRSLLTPGGSIAFTEPVWLQESPPDELLQWWQSEYPAITDEEGIRKAIHAAGFDTIGSFVLPSPTWWTEYYGPMETRIVELRARHPSDPVASEVAATAAHEIAMHRRFADFYSYAFFVVQPRGCLPQ
jgi:trans-aconitate methyltransferase